MAKLKEKDKRPVHIFEVGDVVVCNKKYHGAPTVGKGVIIKIEKMMEREYLSHSQVISGQYNMYIGPEGIWSHGKRQKCWCIFAAREVDLRIAVRKFFTKKFIDPNHIAGVVIENSRLDFKGKVPLTWLQPVTTTEIHNNRFVDLIEEIEE